MTHALRVASLALTLSAYFASTAVAQPRISRGVIEEATGFVVETVVDGLEYPWGMTWLPDGTMLITECFGSIRVVREGLLLGAAIPFPVDVSAGGDGGITVGQGGLLDIAASPSFEGDRLLFFTYSTGSGTANRTHVGRARWTGEGLEDFREIFRNADDKTQGQHFGSRIEFLPDGTLLVSIGDGGNPPIQFAGDDIRRQAQNLRTHFGSVIRISPDGSVPEDNPFIGHTEARPEIWSYGHRNAQGLVRDPQTGTIWENEHGAAGGDELNRIKPGANYGWPNATYSRNYSDGTLISYRISGERWQNPVVVWMDTHAPASLELYNGKAFPDWRGSLLSAGLVSRDLRLITPREGKRAREQRIPLGYRVRDVDTGSDGRSLHTD
ncbi:MAG: PQQ-dependent sugar dehydrogenase [Hyphomicrobium sp.]|nr:PQQ-dependent sugar dehydrogenase [Hyphomicrobium sp.]